MQLSNFSFLEKTYPAIYNYARSAELNAFHDTGLALSQINLGLDACIEIIFTTYGLSQIEKGEANSNQFQRLKLEGLIPENLAELIESLRYRLKLSANDIIFSPDEVIRMLHVLYKVLKWFAQLVDGERAIAIKEFQAPQRADGRHALHLLDVDLPQAEKGHSIQLGQLATKDISRNEYDHLRARGEELAGHLDLTEAETRQIIDKQLRMAGWEADTERLNYKSNKSLPVKGKNLAIAEWPCGGGWADYALFSGEDLIGIVEAKKYASDISTDLTQAKRYAMDIEFFGEGSAVEPWSEYRVPFIFSTNGRPILSSLKPKVEFGF